MGQALSYEFRVAALSGSQQTEWSSVVSATPQSVSLSGPSFQSEPADVQVAYGQPVELTVVLNGSRANRFAWYQDGNLLIDGPGITGATTATLRLPAAVAGHAGEYQVVVTDVVGSISSRTIDVDVTGVTAQHLWMESNFTMEQLMDPTVTGDLVDAEGDGLNNLMEFLLDLSPVLFEPEKRPSIQPENEQVHYQFRLREDTAGVTYTVFVATEPGDWTPVPAGDVVEVSRENGVRTMRVTHNMPPEGRAFYMLQAEKPGP